MDNKNIDLIDSSISNTDNNQKFDIRNLMNYDLIRKELLNFPTELCLFEVTCILINNNVESKDVK